MKFVLLIFLIFLFSKTLEYPQQKLIKDAPQDHNVFIITLDGFRWQELFSGADSIILNDADFTKDPLYAKAMFWHPNEKER